LPAKVKKLGIVETIIASVFDGSGDFWCTKRKGDYGLTSPKAPFIDLWRQNGVKIW
jgi:streptogramin lyase